MKSRRENEELIKVGFRIPRQLNEAITREAIDERRSANDQVIVLLEKALEEKEARP
jgi:hypothetical protein